MKTFTVLIICSFIGILFSFSGSTGVEQQEEMIDLGSGTFYLKGTMTSTEYPCLFCPGNQDFYTYYTDFSVNILPVPGKKDTLRFYGLQGADAGEFDKRVFPYCTMPENCVIYAKLIGDVFEIDISNDGRRYRAQGILKSSTIELEGQYSYENITIDYDLKGLRALLPRELRTWNR